MRLPWVNSSEDRSPVVSGHGAPRQPKIRPHFLAFNFNAV